MNPRLSGLTAPIEADAAASACEAPAVESPDIASRRRILDEDGGPMMLNDWQRAVFVHYRMPPDALQRLVPFELDLYDGDAWLSLVAFTLDRARMCIGERTVAWAGSPLNGLGFLNVRTYVRHQGEPGIYFLTEWLPSRLQCILGPRTFGLPYRFGRVIYEHDVEKGALRGAVMPEVDDAPYGPGLFYDGQISDRAEMQEAKADSPEAFLLERYTAFTRRRTVDRRFRVWHQPWSWTPVDVEVRGDAALKLTGDWLNHARRAGAHYSPGATDVWISRPRCINGRFC